MAKRNRPVLYEVARRHPAHMRRAKPDEHDADRPEPPRSSAAQSPPVPPVPRAEPPPAWEPAASRAPEEPAGSVEFEDRPRSVLADGPIGASQIPGPGWRLSDRGPLIVAGVATAIVLLFLAFALFQRHAEEPPLVEPAPEIAAQQPPAEAGPALAGTPPPETREATVEEPAADPSPTATVELQRGYDYVFVQYFPRSKQRTAEKVALALLQNGIPAALYLAERDIRLIATEAFRVQQPDANAARRERERADALIARIKKLGQEQKPEGYDLSGAALRPIR